MTDLETMLAGEITRLRWEAASFRNGNTALLRALMDLRSASPGAYLTADRVLINAGMLSEDGRMTWDGLGEREAKPWTWQDATVALAKDPAERQMLLDILECPQPSLRINDTFKDVAHAARFLVATAAARGEVLTVEQQPLQPLAMRNYTTVVSTRPVQGTNSGTPNVPAHCAKCPATARTTRC